MTTTAYPKAFLAATCVIQLLVIWWLASALSDSKALVAALTQKGDLQTTLIREQSTTLAQLKSEAAFQQYRVSVATTTATKGRVESEVRVREILTTTLPNDTQELVQWAAAEAQKLNRRVGQ
jgi:hypothetical protein